MWQALLAEGLYVNLARPPATPAGMTLLRCSLCAEHSDEEVARNPRHVRTRRQGDRRDLSPSLEGRVRGGYSRSASGWNAAPL